MLALRTHWRPSHVSLELGSILRRKSAWIFGNLGEESTPHIIFLPSHKTRPTLWGKTTALLFPDSHANLTHIVDTALLTMIILIVGVVCRGNVGGRKVEIILIGSYVVTM